jgi:hypothetical protein
MSTNMPTERWKCLLCGRNRFSRPEAHRCVMGYLRHYGRAARKRGIVGEVGTFVRVHRASCASERR